MNYIIQLPVLLINIARIDNRTTLHPFRKDFHHLMVEL